MQFCLVYRVSGFTEPPPTVLAVFAILFTALALFNGSVCQLVGIESVRARGLYRVIFVGLRTVLGVLLVGASGQWLSLSN